MSNKAEGNSELQQVNEALSRSEQFIEKNQQKIIIALVAIIVIVAGILFFRHSYLVPREKAAQEMIYIGEQYFAIDSFKVALQGNGTDYIGFEGIIDEYGATKTADLAAAYAGLCYKNMGNYEKAIDYLKDSKASDIMVSPALVGAVGDCYVELGKPEKAVPFFEKAADQDNELLSPIYLMKAATVYESLQKYGKALKIYERIKKEYPLSQEGADIEKYIERAKTKK
ncbi:MAG: tetratricopeptide repeat protein [Bacteroidales bacterium]|nr:tetratricopeptide repeat protein [Bacteroidales bacterium]MEA4841176.1 tetratricopeptide repeat protein [Bacteroidales bacterium]